MWPTAAVCARIISTERGYFHEMQIISTERGYFHKNADTQNTVESSSFGSEFIALQIAAKTIEVLRYKLCMFGLTINGPADVFCDNQSGVTNVSIPSYILNKKQNSICYHRFR